MEQHMQGYIIRQWEHNKEEFQDYLQHHQKEIQQVDDALKTNLFANYVKSIGKSKNGGYYTFSSKELEMWFNYCAEKRFFDES